MKKTKMKPKIKLTEEREREIIKRKRGWEIVERLAEKKAPQTNSDGGIS